MARIGARLRAIRRQLRLSLGEVAQRSHRIAQESGDSSFRVSASQLGRLERYEHGFTVNRLLALSEIYNIPIDQMVHAVQSGKEERRNSDQPSSQDATGLPGGLLKHPARHLTAAKRLSDPLPDRTTLLPTEGRPSRTPYLRGIIGSLDQTLNPMIPAGSIVRIDTRNVELMPKQHWTHEFHRPIYFLKTKDAYYCGWCELDGDSHLTLIPHARSSAFSRRWGYPTEVEIVGRVMSVVVPLQA
jgi:transcriptional regulator with XRE-family HTH domain